MSVDYPRAWQIVKASKMEDHHLDCSYRPNGTFLCDCDVLMKHPEVLDEIFQGEDGVPIIEIKRRNDQD